jgi:phosphoglycolate phosphatase
MTQKLGHIFFDFDGTLSDPRRRLYDLFQELVHQSKMTFDEYWTIKRSRVDQKKLLMERFGYTIDDVVAFQKLWLEKVEDEGRIAVDAPFAGVGDFLKDLNHRGYVLSLVTARQNPNIVKRQLQMFGWYEFFAHILVTRQIDTKESLIRQNVLFCADDVFVGDTGEDIQTAKRLGIRSIAVSSGVLSADILKEYNPDFICESVLRIHETGLLSSGT